jgi:HD-GYP domain-containing protein (c-di-GMP phosphodiesterase class II)
MNARRLDQWVNYWVRLMEQEIQETSWHSRLASHLATCLGRKFGLRGEPLRHLRRGALLHDIGKLAIPRSILYKPGPLNAEEWRIMRRHPLYAYDFFAPLPELHPALDVALYHHEKWDGSGYPFGLAGEAIPLTARIFAVVDVWNALRSDRPYRAAWSEEATWSYILTNRGRQFDPQVVDAFWEVLRRNGRDLAAASVPQPAD